MANPASREVVPNLTTELKAQFNFTPDPTQHWLQSDEFDYVMIGGVEQYEWLPTRARVLADGTRFEIGARKVDLEGLLALAKIVKPTAKGIDRVIKFWGKHHKVGVSVEDDWVFMGVDVEPTTEGLSKEFSGIGFAYDLAITAAIEGKTRTGMLKERRTKSLIRQIEHPMGYSRIFGASVKEITESSESLEPEEDITQEPVAETTPRRRITVDTLREFPIDTHETSINFAPATIVRNGVSKEFEGIWLVAHNGKDPRIFNGDQTVDIHALDAQFNDETDRWENDGVSLHLQIPEGVEVKTVEDMAKLTKAEVHPRDDMGNIEFRKSILDVAVTVEDDAVKIVSQDGSLSVEVRKPICDECKIPTWKFRWPTKEEIDADWNPYKEFSNHGANTSLGIYRCDMGTDEGTKTHCFDCARKIDQQYLEAYPLAARSRAIAEARSRLDEAGYADVQICETQVWRTEIPRGALKPAWEFFTDTKYKRDGREIIRHTGITALTDEGEFIPNLLPREFVDFRYKVDSNS